MMPCCELCYEKYIVKGKVDEEKLQEVFDKLNLKKEDIWEVKVSGSVCTCDCHDVDKVVFH